MNAKSTRKFLVASALVAVIILFMTVGCGSIERKMLYYPSHRADAHGLTPWYNNDQLIGYSRKVESPKNVWLMLHGNAGQASDRAYAMPCFSAEDSVFVMEYPGYGAREGVPSKKTFNQAAREAYLALRKNYPHLPVCVVRESIGTGPASSLAELDRPPDKIVLVVAFDKLSLVAANHFPAFLVALVLKDNWDNIKALSSYKGAIEIYGAASDSIIPVKHAKALAAALPGSKLVIIEGGHNEWSYSGRVKIRNP